MIDVKMMSNLRRHGPACLLRMTVQRSRMLTSGMAASVMGQMDQCLSTPLSTSTSLPITSRPEMLAR